MRGVMRNKFRDEVEVLNGETFLEGNWQGSTY